MKKVLLLMLVSIAAFADTLETKVNKMEGMFAGFSQNRIHFQAWDGDIADSLDPARVIKISVQPPAVINLYTTRSPKAPQEVQVKGFANQKFQFIIEGKTVEIPFRQVNQIERRIDSAEFMRKKKNALSGDANFVTVTDMLEAGTATVIHFHSDGSIESQAKGEFCEKLCKESNGKAVYKRVVVSGPTDPIIKRYKLYNLPQFWFFTSRKSVSSRLTEKTEESDISEAFKQAIAK